MEIVKGQVVVVKCDVTSRMRAESRWVLLIPANPKSKATTNHVFAKLKKDGTMGKINAGNIEGLSPGTFGKLVARDTMQITPESIQL